MQPSEIRRALAAATSIASALGLPVDDVIVLHDSNKLTVRLLPCDIVARVAPIAHQVAQFEIGLARRLAETQSPVAALDPRAEPRVYERDGFAVTLWTYYEPVAPREVSPADYANALGRLHAGMRQLDVRTPHFTDRVAEAQRLVESSSLTPDLVRRRPGASHHYAAEPQTGDRRPQRRRAATARRAAPGQRAQHEVRTVVHRFRDVLPRTGRIRPRPCPRRCERALCPRR